MRKYFEIMPILLFLKYSVSLCPIILVVFGECCLQQLWSWYHHFLFYFGCISWWTLIPWSEYGNISFFFLSEYDTINWILKMLAQNCWISYSYLRLNRDKNTAIYLIITCHARIWLDSCQVSLKLRYFPLISTLEIGVTNVFN